MEIIPNLHRVPGIQGVNIYLLLGDTLTLIDAGMPRQSGAILDYIAAQGRTPSDLSRIIISHHHLDHVGSLAALRERTAARVLAHHAEAPIISGAQSPPSGLLARLTALLMRTPRAPVDTTLDDGDQLDLLGGATVVHVPGHTPGSIALHFPAERLLICGDVIDNRRDRLGPPPEAFSVDMDQAWVSLHRLAELDFDILCPGHGAPLVGGAGDQVRAMVRDLA